MRPQEHRQSAHFGTSGRYDLKPMVTPAPNEYRIAGDFDFRDPLAKEQDELRNYKKPKFHYGIKPNYKPPTENVPGPGAYETD